MNIVSIDASTKSTGVAYFIDGELSSYDCLTAKGNDVIARICAVIKQLNDFMSDKSIDLIVIEEVRPESGNLKTYKALMWLQAAINFLVHDRYKGLSIEYLYPNEWRSKCGVKTGRGIKREELKQADIEYVKDRFGISVNDDIADAIGIGCSYFIIDKQKEEASTCVW